MLLKDLQAKIPSTDVVVGAVICYHQGKHYELGEYLGDGVVHLNKVGEDLLRSVDAEPTSAKRVAESSEAKRVAESEAKRVSESEAKRVSESEAKLVAEKKEAAKKGARADGIDQLEFDIGSAINKK